MILKYYKQCWRFLKESRNYLYFIAILFLISTTFGFAYPIFFSDIIKNLIEDIVSKTEGMGFASLFWFIFQNNITTAFIGALLGIFLGFLPLIFCFFNGYVLGFVMNGSSSVGFFGVLARLLPHGIFELPALFISLGIGLRLGLVYFEKRKKKEKLGNKIIYTFKNSLVVFLLVVFPLILIAALIETCLMFIFI
ncbi:MAG: stage II sporulation protein M [Nanoarchaeota archaeon]